RQCLEAAYNQAKTVSCVLPKNQFYDDWEAYHGDYSHEAVDTSVPLNTLISTAKKLHTQPNGFSIHSKLDRLMKKRLETIDKKGGIQWAFAEALAFAGLLIDGVPVRLSGQDCRRGTFSQRHCFLFNQQTGEAHTPLNDLETGQARFSCFNSLLSESGVLGFEYGYAIARPEGLTIWEAQFGDFANSAQSIIDLAATQSKWQRLCGLVMLLPHGYEGMGPEHSSARLERFLQLCAEENLIVCMPSTPAQYYHLLTRQAMAKYRKPLVVMTPKSLMRHPNAVSKWDELAQDRFRMVLDDPRPPKNAKQVLFCSGKIYYELMARRKQLKSPHIAIIRLEQFYPFPETALREILSGYGHANVWHWVQEEPENMGAWQFVHKRLEAVLGKPVGYIGRREAASPASGLSNIYRQEQATIVDQAAGSTGDWMVSS
ncbi:MAG: 2-oxoglutarate dehydrogenase E1 component, partial [Deltaproteobacteria bacterium]|nr:2-oxoglutarate dehydrogenase E1 component [Deltaproteobacteria bacterium]